jgi:hypothetical protein
MAKKNFRNSSNADNDSLEKDLMQKDDVVNSTNKYMNPAPSSKFKRKTKNNNNNKGNNYKNFKRDFNSRDLSYESSAKSSSFSTMNLSTPLISTKFFNGSLVDQNYRYIRNRTITISLTLKPDKDRLRQQASVWARRIISDQDLYLRYILSESRRSSWATLLENVYIYSYFRSVLYALSDQRVAEVPENKVAIKGHAILYKVLLNPVHSFKHDDYTISYDIDIRQEEYDSIRNIASEFDFINNFMSSGTRFYLENSEYDRFLAGLYDVWQIGQPEYCTLGDYNELSKHLTVDNFPIGNSFYSSVGTENIKKWYYAFEVNSSIMTNSTLFGKSCFFCARKDSDCNAYYDLNTTDDQLYLVKYEVSCIASSEYPDPISSVEKEKK